ncbi:MAG TPA: bifunctional phosphoribosylaminoimidazolecarboxamide formyltransferase/IMP cyclohydrolase [Chthonomonadales bacterium]|nr:bifunctional phosphoribosylaminoimidazolecarboxamide formyltransferase/IMP cyclohydrolase [Chthonomonadales bacterium]
MDDGAALYLEGAPVAAIAALSRDVWSPIVHTSAAVPRMRRDVLPPLRVAPHMGGADARQLPVAGVRKRRRQVAKVRQALLSVSDKTGIEEFARGLAACGVRILSTGGTASALEGAGVPVTSVSDVTRFPEILDGRVKTLHPAVHAAILARRDVPRHMGTLEAHGIEPIDLVCVNLYPFAQTVARAGVTLEEAIENIDIGGPSMVRSAAKNHDGVTIVTDPTDYEAVLAEIAEGGNTKLQTRRRLAAKAYAHTARYDSVIASFMQARFAADDPFPQELTAGFTRQQTCRYGENPHQPGAFYRDPAVAEPCISTARQISGKDLSFNNLYDLNAALETVKEFDEAPAAVIVKHTNPCGVALASSLAEAFDRAREADPVSAFGGILATNRPIDPATADRITGKNTFFECIVAPGYEPGVVETLTRKKKWGAGLRLLEVGPLEGWRDRAEAMDWKRVAGGLLVQARDLHVLRPADLRTVTERAASEDEIAQMLFAWRVVRHVKSNAIVLSRNGAVVGVGAGQMNRVQSVRLAVGQAGEKARGAVMASDAFFPFPDGPEAAIAAGVRAIIQPGGSVRDEETIAVCNAAGVAMAFTGVRHFLH